MRENRISVFRKHTLGILVALGMVLFGSVFILFTNIGKNKATVAAEETLQFIKEQSSRSEAFAEFYQGLHLEMNGIIMICKNGLVTGSNFEEYQGKTQAEAPLIQNITEETEPDTLFSFRYYGSAYFGVFESYGENDLYVFYPVASVFFLRTLALAYVMILYILLCSVFLWLRQREEKEQEEREMACQEAVLLSATKEEKANAAKSDFLRKLSYDIRTPINGIRELVELGNRYDHDLEKQRECRKKIWETSDVLLDLISDMVDMDKLESGAVDMELQQAAYAALGDRRGAVIAMEPDTGKILAMVSKPGYDPNTLLQDWASLTDSSNNQGQLVNRATAGLYPPGSTFKIVTALEYMREHPDDYKDFHFDCNGVYHNGDYSIKCFHSEAHGSQDFMKAFANSCNGAFSSLGLTMDLDRFHATAEELLFNNPLPLSGYSYKESSFNMKGGAGTWEVLQTSIGQGTTLITPLHNALITAAVANGGTLMKPYLLDRVVSAGGEEVKKFLPTSGGTLMTATEAANLTELMRDVVVEGTGSSVRTDAYTVAAKTGTAEFETGKETHAWFTGFAPAESPKIVVTVLVEESGSGGKIAGPIARQLFDIYMGR